MALLISVCAMIWALLKKPSQWDSAYADTNDLKPRVEKLETEIAVIQTQYGTILDELKSINRKVGR